MVECLCSVDPLLHLFRGEVLISVLMLVWLTEAVALHYDRRT
jgi:hypothetical protein